MKKSLKPILILLVLLAAVIAGYFVISRIFAQPEESEEPASVTAVKLDGDIKTLSWSVDGKDVCTLNKTNRKWILASDSSFPLGQKTAEDLAGKLKVVDAMRVVAEEPENLEEYGLESPALKITAVLDDNSKVVYSFGDKDMYSSGNYFVSSLEKSVYLVDYRFAEEYPDDVYGLIDAEELPGLAQFDTLEITGKKAKITITKSGEEYKAADGSAEKTVSDKKAEEIHVAAGSLKFDKCVNYKGEYEGYGLDKPSYILKFTYLLEDGDSDEQIENTLVLKIGSQNGDDYFACVDDGEMVYTINGTVIEPLLIDDIESLTREAQTNENDN